MENFPEARFWSVSGWPTIGQLMAKNALSILDRLFTDQENPAGGRCSGVVLDVRPSLMQLQVTFCISQSIATRIVSAAFFVYRARLCNEQLMDTF